MTELYPSVEPALESARKYLTAKVPQAEWLEEFRSHMSALHISGGEIERICDQWAESLNNAGRMSVAAAAAEAAERKKYANGHAKRMHVFVRGWLGSAAFPSERTGPLLDVLKQIGG